MQHFRRGGLRESELTRGTAQRRVFLDGEQQRNLAHSQPVQQLRRRVPSVDRTHSDYLQLSIHQQFSIYGVVTST
ncbi:hypothetical protein [Paraburkholderia sp. WC7.3g]|uniref:hypothetical protein n=1 Tax=Paraburkholderia sp. WC7.3g TaxID=2991070 RepID=UPI003D21CF60